MGEITIFKTIDGMQFASMIISASNHLNSKRSEIDALNVFPVPDGDTGTNMSLTLTAAANETKKYVTGSIGDTSQVVSSASLRGARGNSGVILSQFFRGIAKSLQGKATADAREMAAALQNGVQTAYKAVMKPTEGTILTVARESAAAAVIAAEMGNDIESCLRITIDEGVVSLARTPDLLPVLKESGVVDAGGAGLLVILEGALRALASGESVDLSEFMGAAAPEIVMEVDTENIKFSYCTEFIIDKKSPTVDVARFSEDIDSKGDCKLVIDDDEIVKVHIHTNNPGFVLEKAVKLGMLSSIKIDNMRLQHTTILNDQVAPQSSPVESALQDSILPSFTIAAEKPKKTYGFVVVAVGEGIVNLFKDFGVDEIIEGGQTMNPSTDDILSAIERINADCIYVLPNNKNIILAAQQAADLCDKEIIVLPSRSIPQGIAAILAFLPNMDKDINTNSMREAISYVKTGQVTYAVRDTSVSNKEIKSGDIIGIREGDITVVGSCAEAACKEIVTELADDESSIITVFYGADVDDSTAQTVGDELQELYPDMDVMIQSGGQPLYYYIISVE